MVKTRKNINLTKTKKNNMKNNYSIENIVVSCLEMLNIVKIYHWKTGKYSQHKATDELYDDLNDKIDEFVEILMGKDGKKNIFNKPIYLKLYHLNNQKTFELYIEKMKKYFINMTNSKVIGTLSNTDLLNVRDEILGLLNKFTYLWKLI